MQVQSVEPTVPDHVPAELVKDFPYIFGTTTFGEPHREWAPQIHADRPDIFYAPHAYPGGTAAWVVRRMDHLREIYLDTGTFSSKDFSPYAKLIAENWINTPVEIDPPHHAKYRKMANPLFTPKAVSSLDEKIRAYAIDYVEKFRKRGECEFMQEFAFEFPIKVFLELMDFPHEHAKKFLEWEYDLLHVADLGKMAQATRNVVSFLREQIEGRRRSPRNDIISYALTVDVDGAKLNEDELVGFTFNLFIGGLDTVSTNMGLQFAHLAREHADQEFLRRNPEEISHAIDELMRAYAAVTTFRTCTKEIEFHGVKMMPGDKVMMSTTLAGRDPAEFTSPDQVDFTRRPRHVSFGFGPHTCIGMHLARREMRIALEVFLALIPQFSIKPGHQIEYHLGMIQPVTLPLVWVPDPSDHAIGL
jgi:cytochrome P450